MSKKYNEWRKQVECVKIELNGGRFVVGGKNDGR
jgi:hypothetical protein